MKALIFDTETTGLIANRTLKLERQPEMIEFFGMIVDLKKKKVLKEYGTLIKPKKPLSDKPAPGSKKTITEITGITNEMLKDAPSIERIFPAIVKFLAMGPVRIAHNASFDRDMIEVEAERLKVKVKMNPIICTVEQTIAMKGYRLSLSNLHLHLFNEPFEGAHRASVDVKALTRCCIELFKRGIL